MREKKWIRKTGKWSLFLGIGILWLLFACDPVRAAGEKVTFGSESYEWGQGEENPIGIYMTSDDEMDSFYYIVTYDPAVLEYVSGGVVLSDNEIEVRVNDVNDTRYVLYLYFKPITEEATTISVKEVSVTLADGTRETAEGISVGVNGGQIGPGTEGMLEGITVNGVKVPGFESSVLEYSVYVKSDVQNAEIETAPSDVETEISDTALEEGNNTIQITCRDEAGNEEVYTLNIYRPKALVEDAVPSDEENQGADSSGLLSQIRNSRWGTAMLVGFAALLLLFVVLCVLKIRLMRKRRRQAERRRKRMREREQQLRQKSEEEAWSTGDSEGRAKKQGKDDLDVGDSTGDKKPIQDAAEERNLEIRVSNVTMEFKREKDEASSIKETVIRTLKGQRTFTCFRALDNISFDVYEGEVVGIIGTNGSGKSTMLKIISGALIPTEGVVKVDRQKIQLLTLGTGFDMELTGRENVYLNGAIIGYTKEYIDSKFDEIVKFAELDGFMDEKVKNYSSGMVSRLGFAIATCREAPEILILDEVLSVGDMFFRKKSLERIQKMIHGGSTVLIVSHSTSVIRQNCTKVVWIERGKLRMVGKPDEVCKAYEKMNADGSQ